VKFKLDENLPLELVTDLRHLGHDADTVSEENMAGAPDADVLNAAYTAGRILFTLDKGVANVRRIPNAPACRCCPIST
jgi:predicted nuclease of predicted toxin-antitoxin system